MKAFVRPSLHVNRGWEALSTYVAGIDPDFPPGEIKEAPTRTGGGPGNAPFYIRVGGRTI